MGGGRLGVLACCAGLVAIAVVAPGCSSKPYTVVQQASPNPFKQKPCTLAVDAVAFDRLIVDGMPDAQYAAQGTPELQAKYADDKKAMSFAFKQELVANNANLITDGPPGGGSSFVLKPALVTLTHAGESELVVDLTDASGATLDEFRVKAHTSEGLRGAAIPLGEHVARYLKTRMSCGR